MRRASPLLFSVWSLAPGCKQPPFGDGLSAPIAEVVRPCDALEGESRDWCAVQSLDGVLDVAEITGAGIGEVCTKLRDRDAIDRCAELAVRHPNDPAPSSVCELIHDETMHFSCKLAAADRQLTGPMPEVVDACNTTGILVQHCAAHVIQYRSTYWQSAGFETMRDDVAALIAGIPGVAENKDFGVTVGQVARQLGLRAGMPGPCDAFKYGESKMICEATVRDPNFVK